MNRRVFIRGVVAGLVGLIVAPCVPSERDDTPMLQALIDSNQTVYLPPGDYVIRTTLHAREGTVIRGSRFDFFDGAFLVVTPETVVTGNYLAWHG